MKDISDIYILGVDENRPPALRKEPYIDLYFKLSHKAPETWCKLFNDLVAKLESTPKIDPAQGLIITSWVRLPDDIPAHLKVLQQKVAECTQKYIEKIDVARQAEKDASADVGKAEGPQGRLNKVIAGLDFLSSKPK
jgi:hypothetical protein